MNPRERFRRASNAYMPHPLRLVFLAEAPPALRFSRFFYYPNLTEGDSLFLEMMKVLYPDDVGFSGATFLPGYSAKAIRLNKAELLTRFQRDGFFLMDASEMPMPEEATALEKATLMRASLPTVFERLKQFAPCKETPIVIIGAVTFAVCASPLRLDGRNIVNSAMIKHPARGGQIFFRSELRTALERCQTGERSNHSHDNLSGSIQ